MGEDLERMVKSSTFHGSNLAINHSRDGHGENIHIRNSKTGEDLEFNSEQEFRDWASRDPSRAEYLRMFDGSVMRMDDARELLKRMKKGEKFYLDSDYKIREWSSGDLNSEFTPSLILKDGEGFSPEDERSIKQDLEEISLVEEKSRDEENVLRALAQILSDLRASELSETEIRKICDVFNLDEPGIRKLFGMLDGNPEIRKKRKGFLGIFGETAYYK